MDFDATFSTSRLVSEFPGVIAGPDFPPLRRDSGVCRSSPACGVGPLWQAKQLALKIGTMSASKLGDFVVSAPLTGLLPAELATHSANQKNRLGMVIRLCVSHRTLKRYHDSSRIDHVRPAVVQWCLG